jgi:hypothetical protein
VSGTTTYDSMYGPITVSGRVDCMDEKTIYELKAVDELSLEHRLQLIIYAWIFGNPDLKLKLINARTGECIEIENNGQVISDIMTTLFDAKYGSSSTQASASEPDDIFTACLI